MSMLGVSRDWLLCALAFGAFGAAGAVEFLPPAEGPVAFRRDRLPLDPDQMSVLSGQLETLARGIEPKTAERSRGVAQMLALAMALDPGNGKARELLEGFRQGRHHPGGDDKQLERSRARIWQMIGWLESPDAGTEAAALAACLKDVMVIADPGNPRSPALREAGEQGAWAAWVPALTAYEPAIGADEPRKRVVPDDPFAAPGDSNPPAGSAGDSGSAGGLVMLEAARVWTLLWQRRGAEDAAVWTLGPAPLAMSASVREPDESGQVPPFSIRIQGNSDSDSFRSTDEMLRRLLENQHKKLPHSLRVRITSKEFEQSLGSGRRQTISAAAAVLGSAAITGVEPQAVIIGQVDETGAYKLPRGFWDQFLALGKGSGQRLVVPAEAAEHLPSLLALENPGFFMSYEVVLAADFSELLAMSAKAPSEAHAGVFARFAEIRDKAGNQDIRQYIANRFVRQRLMEISQELPAHFSARMLAVQAAGNRPIHVTRVVLASELRRAIEPMAWLGGNPDEALGSSGNQKLGELYETCRSAVDRLERYAEKTDLEILTQTREMVLSIRNLDRANRSRGESWVVEEAVRKARRDLSRQFRAVGAMLAREAGLETMNDGK
jgi:hypothetical protein